MPQAPLQHGAEWGRRERPVRSGLTSLMVRFIRYGAWPQKPRRVVHRRRVDSLWRSSARAAVPAAAWATDRLRGRDPVPAAERALHHQRAAHGAALSPDTRPWSDRNDRAAAPQWGLSVHRGSGWLPGSDDPARFLHRFGVAGLPPFCRRHARYRSTLRGAAAPRTRAVLDLDSTVLTVYGNQEHAAIGFNPKKPTGHPTCHFCASMARSFFPKLQYYELEPL